MNSNKYSVNDLREKGEIGYFFAPELCLFKTVDVPGSSAKVFFALG